MDIAHKPSKILITGASGTGKTTYWLRYLLGTKANLKAVFDHQGELAFRLGVPAASNPEELGQQAARGWAVFDPSEMFAGRLPEGFAFFCEWAFEASRRIGGRKLFACDELQVLCGTAELSPEFSLVVETGRRWGLDCSLISQAPNLIHNRVRNQLTEVVTFRHVDARAVEWLEEAGFPEEEVRALPAGSYLAQSLLDGSFVRGSVF